MQITSKVQVVNTYDNKVPCEVCGSNLVDVVNFTFDKKGETQATFFEEKCLCKHCHTPFILHYDIFDPEGHIMPRVFVEDINDEKYSWQDPLTPEQKEAVSKHIAHCSTCLDQLSQEMLTDAWLKSYITTLRKKG